MSALKIFAIFLAAFCFYACGRHVARQQNIIIINNNKTNNNNNNIVKIFEALRLQEESQLMAEGYIANVLRSGDFGSACFNSLIKREDLRPPVECPEVDSRGVLRRDCELELVKEISASVLIARERTRNILTSQSYMTYNKMCDRRPFKEALNEEPDSCLALEMMDQVIAVANAIVKLNKEEVSASNIPRANYTQSLLLGIIKGDPENCLCTSFIKLSMLGQTWSCEQRQTTKSQLFESSENGSGSERFVDGGITMRSQEECLYLYEIDHLLTRVSSILKHIIP